MVVCLAPETSSRDRISFLKRNGRRARCSNAWQSLLPIAINFRTVSRRRHFPRPRYQRTAYYISWRTRLSGCETFYQKSRNAIRLVGDCAVGVHTGGRRGGVSGARGVDVYSCHPGAVGFAACILIERAGRFGACSVGMASQRSPRSVFSINVCFGGSDCFVVVAAAGKTLRDWSLASDTRDALSTLMLAVVARVLRKSFLE